MRLLERYPALGGGGNSVVSGPGGSVRLGSVGEPDSPYGMFFYVERTGIEQISMQLHATDTSRIPHEVTKIPLVAEDEFFSAPRSISFVPLDRDSRISLRIFQLDPSMPDAVIVRVWGKLAATSAFWIAFPDLLAERILHFTPADPDCSYFQGCPPAFVYRPNFILIGDLVRDFPEMQSGIDRHFGLRIEVLPAQEGLRYWPLVTVTENTTNHVTVYTVR